MKILWYKYKCKSQINSNFLKGWVIMKNINTGTEFLNLVFKDMKDSIKSDANDPSQRIIKYLERLENSHKEALSNENKRRLLRAFYYYKYIIKKVPDSYIKYRKGYCRNLGLIDKEEITEQDKALILGRIKNSQKKSLDNLLDFLSSDQTTYPTWFKYYIFQGVTKVGSFYPIIGIFSKRSSSTTDPFISLDKNVINGMYGLVSKYLSNEKLSLEEQGIVSKGLNFRNLYSAFHRKNNSINDMFCGNFSGETEAHIGPALLYEETNGVSAKKAGK